MSLSDHEARAMAVKMLNETEIQHLHNEEEKRGEYFLPYQIARFSGIARRYGITITKWWGIPENTTAQGIHADRIKGLLTQLIRVKKCRIDMGDSESRFNFDWHVHQSKIDFTYNGTRKSISQELEDDDKIFARSPVDQKTAAAGL